MTICTARRSLPCRQLRRTGSLPRRWWSICPRALFGRGCKAWGIIAVPVGIVLLIKFGSAIFPGRLTDEDVRIFLFIGIIVGLPAMIIFGVLGMRMRRYADASKALQTDGNMDDAEQCFISSTSFFKISAILAIIGFAFGLLGLLGETLS